MSRAAGPVQHPRRRTTAPAWALAAALTLGGCAGGGSSGGTVAGGTDHAGGPISSGSVSAPDSSSSATGSAATGPSPSAPVASGTGSSPSLAPGQVATLQDPTGPSPAAPRRAPTRVRLPSIGVDSALETLGRNDAGALVPPHDWQRAGWYTESPVPGQRGPAVIAGHLTAPDGPGVFYRLGDLRPGDPVAVTGADGTVTRFTVTSVLSADRTAVFPTEQIYGPTPDAQLRLITCDGHYDPALGHWTRNLVVFARLSG